MGLNPGVFAFRSNSIQWRSHVAPHVHAIERRSWSDCAQSGQDFRYMHMKRIRFLLSRSTAVTFWSVAVSVVLTYLFFRSVAVNVLYTAAESGNHCFRISTGFAIGFLGWSCDIWKGLMDWKENYIGICRLLTAKRKINFMEVWCSGSNDAGKIQTWMLHSLTRIFAIDVALTTHKIRICVICVRNIFTIRCY